MSADQEYRLIPESLPGAKVRKGLYEEIIEEFLEGGQNSVRVEMGGKTTNAIYQGLYQALSKRGEDDIDLRRRRGSVYLVRRPEEAD